LGICLLFAPHNTKFNRNAKVYAKLLLVFTSVFVSIALNDQLDLSGGIILIVAFSVYVFSVASAIYEGIITIVLDQEEKDQDEYDEEMNRHGSSPPSPGTTFNDDESPQLQVTIFSSVAQALPTETTTLLPTTRPLDQFSSYPEESSVHGYLFHFFALLVGFGLLSISATVLIQTTSSLATNFNLSPQVLGLTLLSFSTTIPEKLIYTILHPSSNPNTIIRNISAANIFLHTLCIGVLFCSVNTSARSGAGNRNSEVGNDKKETLANAVLPLEIWVAWSSSLLLNFVVWIGGHRWVGALILGCYGAWVGTELTALRR
jgi:Ca2+/Na+ antiporter